jgi:NAD-dependent SIR2 family protein deacetylase
MTGSMFWPITGAGIGLDSGLPAFRGGLGMWDKGFEFQAGRQPLPYSFVELANPRMFWSNPSLAWAFYGYRLGRYCDAVCRSVPQCSDAHCACHW